MKFAYLSHEVQVHLSDNKSNEAGLVKTNENASLWTPPWQAQGEMHDLQTPMKRPSLAYAVLSASSVQRQVEVFGVPVSALNKVKLNKSLNP